MDSLSFLEANGEILRKVYPGLLEELLRRPGDGDGTELKVETAASGIPTLKINDIYVHSPRDPAREGQRLAEACLAGADTAEGENAPVLVLGFGLGYAAEAVARLAPHRPLIIVEKNPWLLRRAFELRDFRQLLSRPGIAFAPGGEGEAAITALAFFENAGNKKNTGKGYIGKKTQPLVLRNRALTGIDEQWYAAVENRVRAWATQGDVNKATLEKFGRRWIRNLVRNMTAIRDLPGISGLAQHLDLGARPLPFFLAAAGPSLDSMGPFLREIRKRCIVVAVDTSLRFFRRQGVEPDFALVVDPQFWNSRHLDRCSDSRHTRLVAESAVYPPVLRLPFGGTFLCGSLFPLGAFIERRVDPKGLLGAGGSVATSAWDFCRILGAGEIWIAGLDLAFPGNKTHFRGALFGEKAIAESGRLKPAETSLYAALRSGVLFPAPSASGGQVLTDRRLSLYASWFESSFRNSPGVRNYRPWQESPGDTGGLAIPGLETVLMENLLALPERRHEIDGRLEEAFLRIEAEFRGEGETRQRHRRYEDALAALRSGLEKIRASCREGERLAAEALLNDPGQAEAERKKTVAVLDGINRAITGSEVKEIAGFLLPDEALDGIAGLPDESREGFRGYLESCLGVYRMLAESAEIDV